MKQKNFKTIFAFCAVFACIAVPSIIRGALIGDLNGDGTVNTLDYSLLKQKWNQNDTTADLNADGIVNSLDFAILASNWGKTANTGPAVAALILNPTSIYSGETYTATVQGTNLSPLLNFDVQFSPPGSTVVSESDNWQQGTIQDKLTTPDILTGVWNIYGIRPHSDPADHSGPFTPVSASITINPSFATPYVIFSQNRNPFSPDIPKVEFHNYDTILNNGIYNKPYFLYSLSESVPVISPPPVGISDPLVLPMGVYTAADGSAGITVNNATAAGGTYYISDIVPAYNFPNQLTSSGLDIWNYNPSAVLQFKIDMRMPYFYSNNPTGAPPYVFGYYMFQDNVSKQSLWYGMGFADTRPSLATQEWTAMDAWVNGAGIPTVASEPASNHTYASPTSDSAAFVSTAFSDWRTFGFTITPTQFMAAIHALKAQYPTLVLSENLGDYRLLQIDMDVETARSQFDPTNPSQSQDKTAVNVEYKNWNVSVLPH